MSLASAAQLAAKLEKAGENLADGEPAVQRASMHMKRSIERSRDKVTGDGRLSGVGNAKLGVRFDLKTGSRGTATSLMRALGPWQLIEYDTRSAGRVTGKRGKVKRGRTKKEKAKAYRQDLLYVFGGRGGLKGVKPVYWEGAPHAFASFRDGPTKGQYPWKKGADKGEKGAVEEIRKSTLTSVRSAFGT